MEIKELDYKERIINLFGDICEDSVKNTIEKIVDINIKDNEYVQNAANIINSIGFAVDINNINLPPITINLSTYGGVCYDGFSLCDSIRTSTTPIRIVCYGKIMSMGIPILLSASHKVSHKNTIFMIHGTAAGTVGKVESIKEDVNEYSRLEKQLVDYICEHSKFPRKKLEKIIEHKSDYFFTAEEALKYKIIDEIIE